MIIAYALQAQNDHTELKYSLRSIQKFFVGEYEVVIVGDRIPDWLTNVIQIAVPDAPGRKQLNIKRKIIAALRFYAEIFYMMDDLYLLDYTDGNYPYYYHRTLNGVGEGGARPLMEELLNRKMPIKMFDLHAPIIYDRRFVEVFKYLQSDVIIKSAYCNFLGIEGKEMTDLKINRKTTPEEIEKVLPGRNVFSTGPVGLGFTLPVLEKLFPEKSKFEV